MFLTFFIFFLERFFYIYGNNDAKIDRIRRKLKYPQYGHDVFVNAAISHTRSSEDDVRNMKLCFLMLFQHHV